MLWTFSTYYEGGHAQQVNIEQPIINCNSLELSNPTNVYNYKENTMKKTETIYATRNTSAIKAVTDLLCNAKTKMITVDFTKQDGSRRTINGMLKYNAKGMSFNPYERGLIPVTENIITRNSAGQCKTVATQFRMINLSTVSRLAFNRKVIEFI